MKELIIVMYFLIFIIFSLMSYAIIQIKLIGINIKDFWSFIEANQMLDKLYNVAKKYEMMNTQEQIVFLMEAEKIFNAFDKVPEVLWEEEYEKYADVLNAYKNIKVYRWAEN